MNLLKKPCCSILNCIYIFLLCYLNIIYCYISQPHAVQYILFDLLLCISLNSAKSLLHLLHPNYSTTAMQWSKWIELNIPNFRKIKVILFHMCALLYLLKSFVWFVCVDGVITDHWFIRRATSQTDAIYFCLPVLNQC